MITSHSLGTLPVAVEVAGPAGSGKTTLCRLLRDAAGGFSEVAIPTSWQCATQLPFVTACWMRTSVLDRSFERDRRFTWSEVRSMIYLRAWPKALRRSEHLQRICLFDHGPSYRLATLKEFGPTTVNLRSFQNWWQHSLLDWSQRLSLVVWLDAPNCELHERIGSRSQPHVCKSLQSVEAFRFLDRYRSALDEVLCAMQATGNLRVIRFNSKECGPEEIARVVTEESSRIANAA